MRRSIITPPKLKVKPLVDPKKWGTLSTRIGAATASRENWLRRLRRAWNQFDKYDRQVKRLEKELEKLGAA